MNYVDTVSGRIAYAEAGSGPVALLQIEDRLLKLQAPTLIVWGTDDVYFPVQWAHWLTENIPGAKPPVELADARLFFLEEHPEVFNGLLREHLSSN